MRKPIPLVLIMLALVLAACQAQATPPNTALPTTPPAGATSTGAPVASPEVEQPTTPANPAVTEMVGPEAPPGCTVVSQANSSPEDSPFPQVSEKDWVQGPEDAYVTIIEYGDFQ